MKRGKPQVVLPIGLVAALLTAVSVIEAAEMKGKGRDGFVQETVSKLKLPDGRTLERQVLKGFALADDPASPFATINQDCVQTVVMSTDGRVSAGGYCDGIDADGDVYWVSFTGNEKGGTGKFTGIKGGGTFGWSTQWSDGKVVNTWEGTWTVK